MNINTNQLSSYQRFMDFELYEQFRKENIFNINDKSIKEKDKHVESFGLSNENLESYILFTKGEDLKQFAEKYPDECIIEKNSLNHIQWNKVDIDFLYCMELFAKTDEEEQLFLIKMVERSQKNPVLEKYVKEVLVRKKINMVDFLLRHTETKAYTKLVVMDEFGYYNNLPIESMIDKILNYVEESEKYKILADYFSKIKNTNEIPVLNQQVSAFIAQNFSKEECKILFKQKKLSLQNVSEIVYIAKWDKKFFYSLQYGEDPLYINLNIGILIANDLLDINTIRKDINNKKVRDYLTSSSMYSSLCIENTYAVLAEDLQNNEGDSLLHYCAGLNTGNNNIYDLYTLFYNNKSYLNLKNKKGKTFIDVILDSYNYSEIIEILYKDKNIAINNRELFQNIINYAYNDERICSSGENKIIHNMLIATQKNILTEAAKINNSLLSSTLTRL